MACAQDSGTGDAAGPASVVPARTGIIAQAVEAHLALARRAWAGGAEAPQLEELVSEVRTRLAHAAEQSAHGRATQPKVTAVADGCNPGINIGWLTPEMLWGDRGPPPAQEGDTPSSDSCKYSFESRSADSPCNANDCELPQVKAVGGPAAREVRRTEYRAFLETRRQAEATEQDSVQPHGLSARLTGKDLQLSRSRSHRCYRARLPSAALQSTSTTNGATEHVCHELC